MKKILLIGPILRNLKEFRKELIQRLIAENYDVTLVAECKKGESEGIDKRIKVVNVLVDRRGQALLLSLNYAKCNLKLLDECKPVVF